MLNYLPPVRTIQQLPAGVAGDGCFVEETGEMYVFVEGAGWTLFGGSTGIQMVQDTPEPEQAMTVITLPTSAIEVQPPKPPPSRASRSINL